LTEDDLNEPYDPSNSSLYSYKKPKKEEWWKPIIEKIVPIVELSKTIIYPELEVRLGKFGKYGEFRNGVKRDW
jgi:hypothetical protein